MSSILVHACCAPCATASVERLLAEGESPYLFFKNPNIHPYMEFKARLDSFSEYLRVQGLPGEVDASYGLDSFMNGAPDFGRPLRCAYCYEIRMDAAAQAAIRLGISRFTTTLTISPYQDHEAIRAAGVKAAAKHGVEFVYYDFRPLYRKSRTMSKEARYYMQKYCGCAFSEAERYDPAKGGTVR